MTPVKIKKYRIAWAYIMLSPTEDHDSQQKDAFADLLSEGWQPWGDPNIYTRGSQPSTAFQIQTFVKYED